MTTNPTATKTTSAVSTMSANALVNGHGEADTLRSAMPETSLQDVCADLNRRVQAFLAVDAETETMRRTQEQTKVALSVIEKALQDYEFDQLSLSYNGGKDCLVLLILYLSAIHTHFERTPQASFPTLIPSIYAKPPDPFPAVTSFVASSTAMYHLDLVHISTNPGSDPKAKSHSSPPATATTPQSSNGNPITSSTPQETPRVTFRDAFSLYLQTHPTVRAIFVGTRRSDPHGQHLTHFDMTDGNWPRFMRIHPVIDWRLSEIWTFLRSPHLSDAAGRSTGKTGVDYCSMYDEGYTSLGGVLDTIRNPRLRSVDSEGRERYKPAYEMTEDDGERLGRE